MSFQCDVRVFIGQLRVAGLVVEVLLFLGLVGELSFQPSTGGGWLLFFVVFSLVLSDRLKSPRFLFVILAILGILCLEGSIQQVLVILFELLPTVWLSPHCCLIYIGGAVLTLLKGEFIAAALPAISRNHFGNFFFLVVAWLYLMFRSCETPVSKRLIAAVGSLITLIIIHIVVIIGYRDAALTGDLWALPVWRVVVVVIVTIPFGFLPELENKPRSFYLVVIGMLAGLVIAICLLIVFRIPAKTVVFDDSHGPWERTNLPYTQQEWGRDTVYNYRLLYEWQNHFGLVAERVNEEDDLATYINKTPVDALLVLKTPMQDYSLATVQAIRSWVDRGGFAVIISDHTDLFGMTQRLNSILPSDLGIRFDSTAVFDQEGRLTRPITTVLDAFVGTPNTIGRPMLFQTGTSFVVERGAGISLLRYGLSYSEPASYYRPNNFGSFNPLMELAYRNFSAQWMIPSSANGGGYLLIGDSTPWSNFSIAGPGYLHWWKGVIKIAEFRVAWIAVSYAASILALMLILLALFCFPPLQFITSALIAFILAIGITTHLSARYPPDFTNITWQSGRNAVVEFTPGMQPPFSLNYSHLFAALPRWGRIPRFDSGNHPPVEHRQSLLILPEDGRFNPEEWAQYVRTGGHLILIDNPTNSSLKASNDLLNAMDIRIILKARSAMIAPNQFSVSEWNKVPTFKLESSRPTSIFLGRLGQWHRFEVGKGKLDVNLNGFGLSDFGMGDIWGGKDQGVFIREEHANLAVILGVSLKPSSIPLSVLPKSNYSSQVQVTVAYSIPEMKTETEVLNYSCGSSFTSWKIPQLIWCDTADWLEGKRKGPWQMVSKGHWRTTIPVRLANGQDYLGQIYVDGDKWTMAEWVHDGMWGDDTNHRVILRALSE